MLELPNHAYLYVFTKALTYILNDQPVEAIQLLQEGIALNTENVALNSNMKNVITLLTEPKGDSREDSHPEEDDFANETNSVLLDIYKNSFN